MSLRAVDIPTVATGLTLALASCTAVTGCAMLANGPEEQRPTRVQAGDDEHVEPRRSNDGQAGSLLRVTLAGRALPDASGEVELAAAARRFAVTLASWLYGDRSEMAVEPVAPALRRELAKAPPFIPPQQIGSRTGRSVQVRVYVQTPRSGVLVVAIRDSRTSYPIPAYFERRAGRWQIVRLNVH